MAGRLRTSLCVWHPLMAGRLRTSLFVSNTRWWQVVCAPVSVSDTRWWQVVCAPASLCLTPADGRSSAHQSLCLTPADGRSSAHQPLRALPSASRHQEPRLLPVRQGFRLQTEGTLAPRQIKHGLNRRTTLLYSQRVRSNIEDGKQDEVYSSAFETEASSFSDRSSKYPNVGFDKRRLLFWYVKVKTKTKCT